MTHLGQFVHELSILSISVMYKIRYNMNFELILSPSGIRIFFYPMFYSFASHPARWNSIIFVQETKKLRSKFE